LILSRRSVSVIVASSFEISTPRFTPSFLGHLNHCYP